MWSLVNCKVVMIVVFKYGIHRSLLLRINDRTSQTALKLLVMGLLNTSGDGHWTGH